MAIHRKRPRPTAVLVDLDGTIADSAPGITSTLAHTFVAMGLPVPAPAELLEWVGPPILDSFRDLAGFDVEQSARALALYRERYLDRGVADATVYPGVAEALRAIRLAGIPMSLATSKPERPARLMLTQFGVLDHFDVVTGASEDEVRSSKADVVAEALVRLRLRGADLSRVVMVGDRVHDVEGAAAHGVSTVFVTWGYGSPSERAGALAVVDTPTQLLDVLGLTPVARAS